MKKIISTTALLMALSFTALAQCDKKITLSSSKTDHIDATGNLLRTDAENIVIDINKTEIIAVSGDHKITVVIKSNTCNWKVPFKEGKTIIHGVSKRDGTDMNITLTIEGKNGKITLWYTMDAKPEDQVRLAIEKFAEKV